MTVVAYFLVFMGLVGLAAWIVATLLSLSGERRLRSAMAHHHADVPRGRSAVREYVKASRQGYVQSYVPVATIYHYGLYQGPEPVDPDTGAAMDLYMQAALHGDARERALARDRLRELPAERPPRVGTPVAMVAQTRQAPRRVDLSSIPSDSQNVHDGTVVRSVRVALDKMNQDMLPLSDAIRGVRDTVSHDAQALKAVDLMETNTIPLTSLECTESEVLRRVWSRIHGEADKEKQQQMKDMLMGQLRDIAKEASCASGRVARVVDSLSTFDTAVVIRPTWVLRQEMLAKAAVIRERHEEGGVPLLDVLRRSFHQDYVDKGLATKGMVDAELESWGKDLE